jgi:hypothetical protein
MAGLHAATRLSRPGGNQIAQVLLEGDTGLFGKTLGIRMQRFQKTTNLDPNLPVPREKTFTRLDVGHSRLHLLLTPEPSSNR